MIHSHLDVMQKLVDLSFPARPLLASEHSVDIGGTSSVSTASQTASHGHANLLTLVATVGIGGLSVAKLFHIGCHVRAHIVVAAKLSLVRRLVWAVVIRVTVGESGNLLMPGRSPAHGMSGLLHGFTAESRGHGIAAALVLMNAKTSAAPTHASVSSHVSVANSPYILLFGNANALEKSRLVCVSR